MLETESEFIRQLRNDRIAAPTVRRFTEEGWRRDYTALGTGSDDERAVFEAGLWTAAALRDTWEAVSFLNLRQYAFDDLVVRLMALSFVENERQSESATPGRPGRLTADHGATALGDSLWRALSHLHGDRASMAGNTPVPDETALDLLQLCGTIYVLEFLMGRVIHCGWELKLNPDGPIFQPSQAALAFAHNEAIALEIRGEDLIEFYFVYRKLWEEGKLRDEAPSHLRLRTRTPTRASFRIVERPPTDMPETIPLFDMDIPRWLYPLMDTVPNELGGLPARQIVSAWLLLHEVFRVLYEREIRDGVGAPISCVLHESDLLEVFRQYRYPDVAARRIVSFFTYDWSRHESLWASPLVKVGDLYYPFLPAILYPNISRSVDLWLKKCTFTTANQKKDTLVRRRGALFEQFVRAALTEEVGKLVDHDIEVYPNAISLADHEIDLLLRIGSTVYVGDSKFLKYPANPNEIGNYYRELEHGARQVLDRVATLDGRREEIKCLLNWSGPAADLRFSPLVVTGHAYGAGMVLHGVPCIALDMLEMLFREDKYVMSGFDGTIENVRQIALEFQSDSQRFEGFAARYIYTPAAVWFRQFGVGDVPVVCCSIEPDTEVRFRHYFVDIPKTIEREAYCDPLVAQWDLIMASFQP